MSKEANCLSSFSSQLDLLETEGRHVEIANEILGMMMKNVDLSPLAGKIIQFLAVPYPPFKKIMYAFLTRYSSGIAELSLLATNSLLKDFRDPNPFVRRLVLQTTCAVPCLRELAAQLLPQGLRDASGYVRCAAAAACALLPDLELVDALYGAIRDPDPAVVCGSLTALDALLAADGGVAVNARIARYLLRRAGDFRGCHFAAVHAVLRKWSPGGDELLFALDALDVKLRDPEPSVALLAADLALHYAAQAGKDFSGDVLMLVEPQLRRLLGGGTPEALAAALETVEALLPRHRVLFSAFFKLFLCRACDSPCVKGWKLRILVRLADEASLPEVGRELLAHCCDNSREVSRQAVRGFSALLREHPQLGGLLPAFVSLLELPPVGLSEDVLAALSVADLSRSPEVRECVLSVVARHAQGVTSVESKLSLLRFLGAYGRDVPTAPYVLEYFLGNAGYPCEERLASSLLTAAVKLFLVRPEETQLILGRVLQQAEESPSLLLQKQATVYYGLLKDLDLALKVIPVDCRPTTDHAHVLH